MGIEWLVFGTKSHHLVEEVKLLTVKPSVLGLVCLVHQVEQHHIQLALRFGILLPLVDVRKHLQHLILR